MSYDIEIREFDGALGENFFRKMEELCSSGRLLRNLPVFPGDLRSKSRPFSKNFKLKIVFHRTVRLHWITNAVCPQ